jgi:DNA-binding NtrC family response regulator
VKGRILIIEDDEEISIAVSALLGRRGYTVVTANSLNSALQTLKVAHGFNAFVTDVSMGDGNGLDFLNMVSRGLCGANHANTPFLVVTGHAAHEIKEKITSIPNFKGFLQKPFSARDLTEKLDALMPRAAS